MLILTIFSLVSIAGALPNLFQYEFQKAKGLVHQFEIEGGQKTGLGWSWKDCSSGSALVNIKSLSISPDPLAFPGPLVVSAEFTSKADITSPVKAELLVKKKVLGMYIEIPCIDNIGSCTYDDLCAILSQIPADQCPDPLKKAGINCECPIKQNSYSLQKAEFDINASVIPSGEYNIVAHVSHSGAEVACLDMYLNVN